MATPTPALFTLDGNLAVPTDFARGPWDPNALHGGPTSALLARAIERCPTGGVDLDVTRMTVELLRPVPVAPLAVEAAVVRPGRKVQLLEATMREAGTGTEVARARALRIRTASLALPEDPLLEVPGPPPGPESVASERSTMDDYEAFHNTGTEHRFVAGTFADAGPVTVWIRLQVPVIAGEAPSSLERVMAAADFGNGVSRVLSWETHLFINPDLTVHLLRPAVGEWVALEARTALGPSGHGIAESALYDERGLIGRAVQSVLVDRR
jgi:hypothetical protein